MEFVGRGRTAPAMLSSWNRSPNTNVSSVASILPKTWRGFTDCRLDGACLAISRLCGNGAASARWGVCASISSKASKPRSVLLMRSSKTRGSAAIGIWKTGRAIGDVCSPSRRAKKAGDGAIRAGLVRRPVGLVQERASSGHGRSAGSALSAASLAATPDGSGVNSKPSEMAAP